MATITPPPGHTWIDIDSFTQKYMSVMPQDLFVDLQKAYLRGATQITITTSTIKELDKLLSKKSQL